MKAMCKTSIVVSTQAAGKTEILSFDKVAKTLACMTARVIMDEYPRRPSYDTIASFGKADVHLPRPRNGGEVPNAPVDIVHVNSKHYSCHQPACMEIIITAQSSFYSRILGPTGCNVWRNMKPSRRRTNKF